MPELSPQILALGVLWYVVFLMSTTLHEASHALVAKWGGDLTAFRGGQVSLDPRPHIRREPFGMVIIPILFYFMSGWMIGWASTPFDPDWERRHPRRAAWMAAAGPAANLLLVILATILIRTGIAFGWFEFSGGGGLHRLVTGADGTFAAAAAQFLSILFLLNLLLFFFNILPIPPLDGHSAIRLVMPARLADRFMRFWRENTWVAAVGFLLVWFFFWDLFQPVLRTAIRWLLFFGMR